MKMRFSMYFSILFSTVLLFLLPGAAQGQQSVTLTNSVPYQGTVSYSQVITITGLPPGCVPTISAATITITGCPSSLPVNVGVSCNPVSVAPGATVTCSASVTNAANTSVQWSSSSGTISTTGVLVVPAVPGTVTVTARSAQDNTKSGSAVITVVAPATGMQVEAESAAVSSAPVNIQPTQDVGGGSKVVATVVGQTYDYHVTMPVAGMFAFAVRICNQQNATGTSSVHFEYPQGVNVSGPLTLLNGTQWTTVSALAGKYVNIPAGAQTIRLVVDAIASGGTQLNWFSLTPVNATAPSVKLQWNPSTSAYVLGYNVYRGSPGGPYSKLTDAAISGAPYIDTAVTAGTSYGYVVTAWADPTQYPGNNESAYSNEGVATIPTSGGTVLLNLP